jgi:hypothetical protein
MLILDGQIKLILIILTQIRGCQAENEQLSLLLAPSDTILW